jgi:hypothetical protein
MANDEALRVDVYWYQPDDKSDGRARASLRDIHRIINELTLIRDELSQIYNKEDAEEATAFCRFHYDNFLFRVYMLRDRIWDILATLANMKREGIRKASFRMNVLSEIRRCYNEIFNMFSLFDELVRSDVDRRNVATHGAFLHLGMSVGTDGPYDIIDEILLNYDTDEEHGSKIHKGVKIALCDFSEKKAKYIQAIVRITMILQQEFAAALSQKQKPNATI